MTKRKISSQQSAHAPPERSAPRTGKRQVHESTNVLALEWPSAKHARTQDEIYRVRLARYELFDAWHGIMMQIIHRDTGNFRLAAILKIIINWDTGTLSLSYSAMAEKAGNCCSKTISREVKRYESLGLFVSTRGWKRPDGKAFKKRNTLRLAVPVQLPEGIFICDLVKQNLDTRGPDSATTQTDTGGPLERDSSGPITMYDHKKGRGRSSKAAAAVQRHQSPSIDATRQRRPAHQRAGEGAQCDLFGNGETS